MGIGDFVGDMAEVVMRDLIVKAAFHAGQNAEPPPVRVHEKYQEISDEAYKAGQQSVLVKLGKKLAE